MNKHTLTHAHTHTRTHAHTHTHTYTHACMHTHTHQGLVTCINDPTVVDTLWQRHPEIVDKVAVVNAPGPDGDPPLTCAIQRVCVCVRVYD